MIATGPGTEFEAFYESGVSGLVGTVAVAINDNENNVVFGPTTAGIIELEVSGTPTGVYSKPDFIAPLTEGQYTLVWSPDGLFDPITVSTDDLLITESAALPSILPGPPGASADTGPCSMWTTVDDLIECCPAATSSSDSEEALETNIAVASQILWELSGRRYNGTCGKIVRPCRTGCGCWPLQRFTSAGSSQIHYIWSGRNWASEGSTCGCGCTPQILLSGYPVQGIVQVKVNGEILSGSAYRLDEKRYLTRTDGGHWPVCQDIARADTEDGTWSVSYVYGEGPPLAGALAAQRLACELINACTDGAECQLPTQAVRIVRQGITIETLQPLAQMLVGGSTGLVEIDSFIAGYGRGPRRRPSVWSPEADHYARPVGG